MFETAIGVKVLKPYVVEVTFDDGKQRQIDLEPELWGEVFEPLRDPEFFAQVEVDPELGTVVWPNGADLAPEFLYYGEDTRYGHIDISPPQHVYSVSGESRRVTRPTYWSAMGSGVWEGEAVPRVSEFYGIVISMYYRDHAPPHFHAQYGEHEAVIGIDPIRVMEGRLPNRARSFTFEWAALHQDELRANWERAQHRQPPVRIAPLE